MTPMTQTKRAISIRLTREARELIENSNGQANVELEVNGHEYSLLVNGKKFPFEYSPVPETDQHVFTGVPLNTGHVEMQLVADVTHSSAIKRVLSEQDRARFRNKVQEAERARKSRTTTLVDAKQIQEFERQAKQAKKSKTAVRKESQRRIKPPPAPAPAQTRPPPQSRPSPQIHPLSTDSPPAALSHLEMHGLQRRLMHFLATGTYSFEDICKHLEPQRSQERACIVQLLNEIAAPIVHGTNTKYTLSLEYYQDLDIQGWNYTDSERERAIEKSKRAKVIMEKTRSESKQTPNARSSQQSDRRGSSTDDDLYSKSSIDEEKCSKGSGSETERRSKKDGRNKDEETLRASDNAPTSKKRNREAENEAQRHKQREIDGDSKKSGTEDEGLRRKKRDVSIDSKKSGTEEEGLRRKQRDIDVDKKESGTDDEGSRHKQRDTNDDSKKPSKVDPAEELVKKHGGASASSDSKYISAPICFEMEKITNDAQFSKWRTEMLLSQKLYRHHKASLLEQGILEKLQAVMYEYQTEEAEEILYLNYLADKVTKIHDELTSYINSSN